MGLFSTKKKEDPSSNSSAGAKQQRPSPSSNNAQGPNSSSHSMQGGVPMHGNSGYNGLHTTPSYGPGGANNASSAPMSPVGQQAPFSPAYAPPSSTQFQNPNFSQSGPPGAQLSPQLFWTQRRILGTNPFPRFQHTTSATVNGTDIYLYGGSQRGTTKGDLFVIDSVSLECQAIAAAGADPPMPKSGHSAVNIGQYIIYFGGWNPTTGQCDDSLHVLHTGRKEWNKPSINGSLPTPRHSHIACTIGTVMFIFGGQVDNYYLHDIMSFDMRTITQNAARWEKLEPQTESPPARAGHCAAVHDGRIYIFGGVDAEYFYNDIWCFDPRALTWTPIPASGYLPTGRHGHSCTVADGIMYIFGGNGPEGIELNDAYAFKIHERRWYLFQNVGPVASIRSGHTMCTIKDRIFVLGGESEQTKQEDSALIYFLEISKIRYPDSGPSMIPARHASQRFIPNMPIEGQAPDQSISGGYESDRSSGQSRPQERDRHDRRNTQRPASPGTFGSVERHGSSSSTRSQQNGQMGNSQHGRRPSMTIGAPPPRGSSTSFQSTDYQAENTRRQTLRDDIQGGYGGGAARSASLHVNTNRATTHQLTSSPSVGGPSPSPLRVINVSPTSPPASARPLGSGGENTTGFVPPPASGSNVVEDINPYAMEAITSPPPPPPPQLNATQSVPPAAQNTYVPPPPSFSSPSNAANSPTTPSTLQPIPPGMIRTNHPIPPMSPTSPTSTSAPNLAGSDKKSGQVPPLSAGVTTPIPGPLDNAAASRASIESTTRAKALESKFDAVQEENEQLKRQLMEKQGEMEKMKKRELWLMTEVILARDSLGTGKKDDGNSSLFKNSQNKRMSIMDLEKELEGGELDGQQLKITKALIKVKEELKTAKMSIATQAQAASSKIREAERVRTGALQEAAYLKAKLSSMSNADQDPSALARVEMERAADLEKRLTSALNELEILEAQYGKSQESLEQEKLSRISAEERSRGSALLAEQAQSAHTRALAEITSLHGRATKAEAESREFAAQLAESQAGFTSHQSQSTSLLQKIKSLKEQIEEHEKALEKTQLAYSAANDRATRAETRADEASVKIEKLESLRFELSSEATRYKGEAELLQSKVEDLENRLQVSKDEVMTLRKLVEDGLGAFSPRGRVEKSEERKHDSIAILNTVSKMSEMEQELTSLKKLHALSQQSASKSGAELAEAMMEISRLEQVSMQARTETISLQKTLSQERGAAAQLKSELSRTELELEAKIKEIEDHEVQLGLLKDVMREKGIIAEDVIMQARVRGTPEYAATMEEKLKDAEERSQKLQRELKQTQSQYSQKIEALENQRQSSIQYSERTTTLLRKIKDDLEATMQEKDMVEAELKQLLEEHSRCHDMAASRENQKEEEEERVRMLMKHFDEERRGLTSQANDLQSQLTESEMHAEELSRKVVSVTERLQEVEGLNESMVDELDNLQMEYDTFKDKATKQEEQLKADLERLVNEVRQVQEKLHGKQVELDDAHDMNEQLERQLERVTAAAEIQSKHDPETLKQLENQRQDLEQRLKKAQQTIQILEGDNTVLETKLAESEKKVSLLLENIQNSMSDASNPVSPLNSANLAGVHQQVNSHFQSKGALVSPTYQSSPVTSARRLIDNARTSSQNSKSSSPAGSIVLSPTHQATKVTNGSSNGYLNQLDEYSDESDDEYQYGHATTLRYQPSPQQQVLQQQRHLSPSNRDSMDSITRELEMLKVPWNKGPVVHTSPNVANKTNDVSSTSPKHSPTVTVVPQQQPPRQMHANSPSQHTYQYSGKLSDHQPQFYDYTDSSEEDEEEYLAHLRQQKQQQQQQQQLQKHAMDTHSFNDRSPSRLKEYEQMIDEIENSRQP